MCFISIKYPDTTFILKLVSHCVMNHELSSFEHHGNIASYSLSQSTISAVLAPPFLSRSLSLSLSPFLLVAGCEN